MENKIKFSDQPMKVKIVYVTVIAVLCVTAIVIGIVSAANKKNDVPDDTPSLSLPNDNEENNSNEGGEIEDNNEDNKKPDKLTFTSPVVGEVTKGHSLDMPVFSSTLQEWRVHTGIDISADEGTKVFAAADGVVGKVYNDAMLGKTVEITHEGGIVSLYSNLDTTGIAVAEGDTVKAGAVIGLVGDSSISELAEEGHLHFAIKVNGVSVNPLDYISEDSKKAALGITEV